jgi:hypothetical protein
MLLSGSLSRTQSNGSDAGKDSPDQVGLVEADGLDAYPAGRSTRTGHLGPGKHH